MDPRGSPVDPEQPSHLVRTRLKDAACKNGMAAREPRVDDGAFRLLV